MTSLSISALDVPFACKVVAENVNALTSMNTIAETSNSQLRKTDWTCRLLPRNVAFSTALSARQQSNTIAAASMSTCATIPSGLGKRKLARDSKTSRAWTPPYETRRFPIVRTLATTEKTRHIAAMKALRVPPEATRRAMTENNQPATPPITASSTNVFNGVMK